MLTGQSWHVPASPCAIFAIAAFAQILDAQRDLIARFERVYGDILSISSDSQIYNALNVLEGRSVDQGNAFVFRRRLGERPSRKAIG